MPLRGCYEHAGLCHGQSDRSSGRLPLPRERPRGGKGAMEVMYERVVGLEVGKDSVTVCVRASGTKRGRRSQTRTFKTVKGHGVLPGGGRGTCPVMFASLRVVQDCLVENGVEIAAVESTSTYWKGPVLLPRGSRDGVAAERRPT